MLDDCPRQDLVAFSAVVQKELAKQSERAGKQAHFRLDKIARFVRPPQTVAKNPRIERLPLLFRAPTP